MSQAQTVCETECQQILTVDVLQADLLKCFLVAPQVITMKNPYRAKSIFLNRQVHYIFTISLNIAIIRI